MPKFYVDPGFNRIYRKWEEGEYDLWNGHCWVEVKDYEVTDWLRDLVMIDAENIWSIEDSKWLVPGILAEIV